MAEPGTQLVVLQNSVSQTYCNLAALVIILYDYELTFDDELEAIWRRTPSLSAISVALFASNRYLPLVLHLCRAMRFQHSDKSCQHSMFAIQILTALQYIPWGLFSGLRAYALSRRSAFATCPVLVLYAVPLVLDLVQLRWAVVRYTSPICETASTVGFGTLRIFEISSWLSLVIADSLVLAITRIQVHSICITKLKKESLEGLIVEHGTREFCILLVLDTLHLAFSLRSPAPDGIELAEDMNLLIEPLRAILVSRFLLSLHNLSLRLERGVSNTTFDTLPGEQRSSLSLSLPGEQRSSLSLTLPMTLEELEILDESGAPSDTFRLEEFMKFAEVTAQGVFDEWEGPHTCELGNRCDEAAQVDCFCRPIDVDRVASIVLLNASIKHPLDTTSDDNTAVEAGVHLPGASREVETACGHPGPRVPKKAEDTCTRSSESPRGEGQTLVAADDVRSTFTDAFVELPADVAVKQEAVHTGDATSEQVVPEAQDGRYGSPLRSPCISIAQVVPFDGPSDAAIDTSPRSSTRVGLGDHQSKGAVDEEKNAEVGHQAKEDEDPLADPEDDRARGPEAHIPDSDQAVQVERLGSIPDPRMSARSSARNPHSEAIEDERRGSWAIARAETRRRGLNLPGGRTLRT